MHNGHNPVLLNQAIEWLAVRPGGIYLDATFGGGGYARAILEGGAEKLYVMDRDPYAIERARSIAETDKRLIICEGPFSCVSHWVAENSLDGAVLDLGVSSFQIDEPHRGFSFRFDGPLDMRMNPYENTLTAADIVNRWNERDLAHMLFTYGQEPRSRAIAKAIVEHRAHQEIVTTGTLAHIVRKVVARRGAIDPCTLTFQALRICVNHELLELDTVLRKLYTLIRKRGRVVVVSFHELEDRIAKRIMRSLYHPLTKKPVVPTREHRYHNPRCRSAKLRVAEVPV